MIKGFRHKGLEQFYRMGSKAGIQPEHAVGLRKQLTLLEAAVGPEDVNVPGYQLHSLKGDLTGQWAIKVDKNWRLTFSFEGADVILLDYRDYH